MSRSEEFNGDIVAAH